MAALSGPSDVPVEKPTARTALDDHAGDPCGYADCSGQLERTTYKGNDALVCDACETPALRVW